MPNKFIPPQTTTSSRTAATPIDGEILYDTDEKKLYYGDGTTVGGKAIGSPTVTDDVFRIQDNSDNTKQLAFETSGITTGTTRTLTVPDSNGTVLSTDTLTDKALYYYDASSKLFKPVGIGTLGQTLIAQPSSNPPYQWATPSGGREVLTANRTYYVRTDGSDSNNGLTNTAGGAFLTGQKAADVIGGLDLSIYDVTIQFRSGTFAGITVKQPVGAGVINITGDTTTPANVVINSQILVDGIRNVVRVGGFRFTANAGTGDISSRAGSVIELTGNCTFASTGSVRHIYAEANGVIRISTNYSITAGCIDHLFALLGGIIQYTSSGFTTTLTGTPTFGYFADATRTGVINIPSTWVTYSGSATGSRYLAAGNGVIFTNGGGSTYFPGSLDGTPSTGGQYL